MHVLQIVCFYFFFFFFKQKTAYEMRISDWSSDVCSSDLGPRLAVNSLRAPSTIVYRSVQERGMHESRRLRDRRLCGPHRGIPACTTVCLVCGGWRPMVGESMNGASRDCSRRSAGPTLRSRRPRQNMKVGGAQDSRSEEERVRERGCR